MKILFVCLGNICRSPMAEAVMKSMVQSHQVFVDSCGTGSWHVGEPAHKGTCDILTQHGIESNYLVARHIHEDDFKSFDYILGCDASNVSDLKARSASKYHSKIGLLLDWSENYQGQDIPDPYYTGNFEQTFEMVEDGCQSLLKHLKL